MIEHKEDKDSDLPDQLEILKKRAAMLGLKHHHNIGITKLSKLIADHMNKDDSEEQSEDTVTEVIPAPKKASNGKVIPPAPVRKSRALLRREALNEANRLIRINVTCMDPNKREYPGELIMVSNARIGTIKKFVQFGTSDGYHVPYVIYKALKDKKFQIFPKNQKNKSTQKGKLINAYNVEVLDGLTPKELKALANQQKMAQNID